MLEVETAIEILTVLVILPVVVTIVKQIFHPLEAIGRQLLTAAKVSAKQKLFQLYITKDLSKT